MKHKQVFNIFAFLDQYEKYVCLWDPKDPNYKNKNMRLIALKNIVQKAVPFMTTAELKLKIRNIRTTYSRELAKIFDSQKVDPDNIYVPRLIWFERADKFLRPVLEGKSNGTLASPVSAGNPAATDSDSSMCFEETVQDSDSNADKTANAKEKEEEDEDEDEEYKPPIKQPKPKPVVRIKRTENVSFEGKEQDEFTSFADNVASHLRAMPLANALMCEGQIMNFILDERLKIMNEC